MCAKQANYSVSIFPAEAVFTASVVLTEIKHRWNKSPSDDKLAALEQLLKPLFGFFAQFSHVCVPTSEDAVTPAKDKIRGSDVKYQAANGCFNYADALWTNVEMEVGSGFTKLSNTGVISHPGPIIRCIYNMF